MKKLSLLIATVLLAGSSLAQAQQAANPFARPSATSPTTPSTTSPNTGAPGSVPGVVHNPNVTNPMPGMQPGVPGGQPGMLPPGVYPPSPGVGMPGVALPGAPANNGPDVTEEEVTASRIGKVNGMHIYRGQHTYMFESSKSRKVVRKLIPQAPGAVAGGTGSAAAGSPNAEKNPNLPSMVGRPAPSN